MRQYCLKTAKGQRILVDYDVWRKYRRNGWHVNKGGYPMCTMQSKHWYLHRLIMQTPKGMYTDHISGDKLDNRRSNLRIVTHSQNLLGFNSYPNKNGLRGVTRHHKTGKWMAQITINYVHKYLGLFKTKALAHQAYLQAKQSQL